MAGSEAKPFLDRKIEQRKVMLFSKTYSPECKEAKTILGSYDMDQNLYEAVEIENRQDCNQIENYFQILCLTDTREVPQLFINGKYIGGDKEIKRLHASGNLKYILETCGIFSKKQTVE